LIYKCGGIDKRTIEKFEKVRIPPRRRLAHIPFALSHILPLGGASLRFPQSTIFCARGVFFGTKTSVDYCPTIPFYFYTATTSTFQLLTLAQ
jgi:hypothetical protein